MVWSALALAVPALPTRADEASDPLRDGPGPIPGAPSIEASLGIASVLIPIEVPPGRHGMAPQIALRYSSASGNGNAGYGFSLSIGSIERSTRSGAPRFDNTDTFVLNLGGESLDLVAVDGASTRFRTVIDSGYLIERIAPGPYGAGSSYFVARGRDGRRYRFGFLAGSTSTSQVENFKWGLDRIEDTSGNVLEIAWAVSGRHLYPIAVDYASHPATSLPATNRVELCWEARSDQTPTPAGERLTHRLHEVRTFAGGQPARSYTLSYGSQVNLTDGLGTCRSGFDAGGGAGRATGSDPRWPGPPGSGRGGGPRMMRPAGSDLGPLAAGGASRTVPGDSPSGAGAPVDSADPAPGSVADPAAQSLASASYLMEIARGDGAGAFLPPIRYQYGADRAFAWPQPAAGYASPLPFLYSHDDADEDSGTRLIDLNRDGRPDLIQFEGRAPGSTWAISASVFINNGSALVYDAAWTAGLMNLRNSADESRSGYFVIKRGTNDRVENGVRFLDVNDDGYPDVVRMANWFGQGLRKEVFLNTGAGFTGDVAASYAVPDEAFVDLHADPSRDVAEDLGVRLADVNGDGRLDILVARAEWGGPSERRVYLYDRNGFRLDAGWILPDEPFVAHVPHGRTLDMGVRILELNGDGFPDLLRAANVNGMVVTRAYLNNGMPAASGPAWIATDRYGSLGVQSEYFVDISTSGDGRSYDRGLRVADIDGDGVSDIVVARQWNGGSFEKYLFHTFPQGPWTYSVLNTFPWIFVTKPAGKPPHDLGVRLADLNGDGGVDLLLAPSGGGAETRLNGAWQGRLLLSSYSNGLGGETRIRYAPAPHGGTIEGGQKAAVPFPIAVVASLTQADGLGGEVTTSYAYDGGFFHHAAREFRGFRSVTQIEPGGAESTETLFLQQPGLRNAPLRGAPVRQIARRIADGRVFSRIDWTYDVSDALPPLRHLLLRSETTFYDWSTTNADSASYVKRSATSWSYLFDDGTGPDRTLLRRIERQEGDVDDPEDDRVVTEEMSSSIEAAASGVLGSGAWLLELPWHESLQDATGVVVSESWTGYDGGEIGQVPVRGLVTRVERRGGPQGPTGAHGRGDPDNPIATKGYDAYGNLASETDPLGRVRLVVRGQSDPTFTFPEIEIDPLNRTTTRSFDPRTGLLTRLIDANGRAVAIEYDAFGRRLAEWGPLDSQGHPTVSYQHDYTRVPARVTRFARETSGQGDRSGTNGCLESTAYFDGLGRLIEIAAESESGRVVTRAVAFDAAGRLLSEAEPFTAVAGDGPAPIDAAPYARRYEYDEAGRLTAAINGKGEAERRLYTGWTTTTVDPLGHRRAVARDAFGQVTEVEEFEGSNEAAAPVPPARYVYDAAGHLTEITDPVGTRTTVSFDALGRRLTLDDPHIGSWSYRYDLKGNLAGEIDPDGRSMEMTYDALDRLTAKTLPDGQRFQWHYDEGGAGANALGRLTYVSDPTGSQRFTYDPMGRVVLEVRALYGSLLVFRNAFDAMGRVTSRTLPGGTHVDYLYDAGGDLKAALPYAPAIQHDARGLLTSIAYMNQARAVRGYDPATGRPAALDVFGPNESILLSLRYTQDADGLITTLADFTDVAHPASESFSYDSRHRLAGASGPYGAMAYAYDDAGTLTLKDGVAYQRDDPQHPQWVTRTAAGGRLSYDRAGCALAEGDPPLGRTFEYDARGRMIRLTDPAQGLVSRTDYDADGRPVRELSERQGQTATVLWGGREVEIHDGQRTLNIFAGALHIATIAPDGRIDYPILDHLGTARIILDSNGQVASRVVYRPYGSPSGTGPADPATSFRFAGARVDGAGLLVMGWRHYDPALGRFLEPDPLIAAPLDPQSLNRYSYARDNPVNLVDPSGRNPIPVILFIGSMMLLSRDTRIDVAGSVGLTAATIMLTGALGPGSAAGFAALKASLPALYAAAASTVILDSALGEGIVNSYSLLLQDLGMSERGAQMAARMTTAWFFNSSLQRGFGAALAPAGKISAGDDLGDRGHLDDALAQRGADPQDLGGAGGDAYGTTVSDLAGADGRSAEMSRFTGLNDASGTLVGVVGVRDLGPLFDHGAVGFVGTGTAPAVTHPHYLYGIGGISTQQVARDLFSAGYSGSLFALTGRTSDFLIEMIYGPYGGGLAFGIGAARSSADAGRCH